MSGLTFADDYVGIPETPEGLHQHIGKSLLIECIRKRRGTANVKKCAIVVCNADTENPVTF